MFTKNEVSRCGTLLITCSPSSSDYQHAIEVLETWRDAHLYPMEQMEHAVRMASADIDGAVCVSRLKRRDTIIGKLARPNNYYTLKNMDDIAGCRCIVPTVEEALLVADRLMLFDGYVKTKDYIRNPKDSGYRGIHLFHRCDSHEYGYKNLRIETQVRTRNQHAWATAVETYDVLTASKLKFGYGREDIARVFTLMSNLIANYEGCTLVHCAPKTTIETIKELKKADSNLRIISTLRGFSCSVKAIQKTVDSGDVRYYLLEYNYADNMVTITAFTKGQDRHAAEIYSEKERNKKEETDVLLVMADSIEGLKAAYPNYFSDISYFLETIDSLTIA